MYSWKKLFCDVFNQQTQRKKWLLLWCYRLIVSNCTYEIKQISDSFLQKEEQDFGSSTIQNLTLKIYYLVQNAPGHYVTTDSKAKKNWKALFSRHENVEHVSVTKAIRKFLSELTLNWSQITVILFFFN